MFERFERPVKIICLGLAAALVWQLASLFLTGDPLAHLKIPALPTLTAATNEPAKGDQKATNAAMAIKAGTNGVNSAKGTNVASVINTAGDTNVVHRTNATNGTNLVMKSTNEPGLSPGALAQMMGGAMPGGRRGGGIKKVELPPEVQTRVDKIIDSELFGPVPRPVPMALLGIADQEAYLQATNGQTGPVKIGGEIGGIKLLRIGTNRVLVEQDGEKKELTLFGGLGGESLMPKPTNEPTLNVSGTNVPSPNGPVQRTAKRKLAANNATTNQTISSKQKEIP